MKKSGFCWHDHHSITTLLSFLKNSKKDKLLQYEQALQYQQHFKASRRLGTEFYFNDSLTLDDGHKVCQALSFCFHVTLLIAVSQALNPAVLITSVKPREMWSANRWTFNLCNDSQPAGRLSENLSHPFCWWILCMAHKHRIIEG